MPDSSSLPSHVRIDFEQFADKTLDLELSRTARAFEPGERIWDPELRRMVRLIEQHTQGLAQWLQRRDQGEEDRLDSAPMLSIAIFGTYGSGKSSLLKTFVREARKLNQPHASAEDNPAAQLKDLVYSLPVLEPNILSKDDHFLYSFLATALEEDLKQHREDEDRLAAGSHNLSPVQQAFQRVSEFLQVIDPPPSRHEYDPLGLSLERLDRHTSGFRLRTELHGLIESLAHNLAGVRENSVLILPVDDADMSLDKLTATLDTYRRYLLHPRLVPVFTFTGHLAEELLQVNFAEDLSYEKRQRIRAGSSQSHALDITEHLAYQYLVKLFPIRNRIKLGYAPARVQAGRLSPRRGPDDNGRKMRVMDLLEISSILLFGVPKYPIAPRVRKALRPATLRRQLQVIDAMYECGANSFLGEIEGEGSGQGIRLQRNAAPWTVVFNRAAWSLLNVHRDVLREFGVHLESLYGWTPRNLRREVLRILLDQDQMTRRTFVRRWRYRVEGRRNQILSLLALMAFRPQLPGEEASGDDPDRVRNLWVSEGHPQQHSYELAPQHIAVPSAFVWFLDLWIGFYLPQILARTRPSQGEIEKAPSLRKSGRPVHAIGWSLRSGPLHAVSVLNQTSITRAYLGPGMVRLEADSFFETLNDFSGGSGEVQTIKKVTVLLWSAYGLQEDGRWATLSLWRGLGLVGQICNAYQSFLGTRSRNQEERGPLIQQIRKIMEEHLKWALRPGHGVNHDGVIPRFGAEDSDQDALNKLAGDMCAWMESFREELIDLIAIERLDSVSLANGWQESFIPRLHGEFLLGRLWPDLDSSFFRNGGTLDASTVLSSWMEILEEYWTGIPCASADPDSDSTTPVLQKKMTTFLRTCPLLLPWFSWTGESWQKIGECLGPRELESLPGEVANLRNLVDSIDEDDESKEAKKKKKDLKEAEASLEEAEAEWDRCWPKLQLTTYYPTPSTTPRMPQRVEKVRAALKEIKVYTGDTGPEPPK